MFFGRSLLKLIAGGFEGPKGIPAKVVHIPIDWDSDEPEELLAIISVEKDISVENLIRDQEEGRGDKA